MSAGTKRIAKVRAAFTKRVKRWRKQLAARVTDARGKLKARVRKIKARFRPAITVMYDSVTVSAIPETAQAVGGYVAGDPYPNVPAVHARCPKAKILTIALYGRLHARCLDIEQGGATNSDAAPWFRQAKAAGVDLPVFYTSVSNGDALIAVLASAGVGRHEYLLWTAHYGAGEHRCSSACYSGFHDHADATQWTNAALGRNLDQSLLARHFFS